MALPVHNPPFDQEETIQCRKRKEQFDLLFSFPVVGPTISFILDGNVCYGRNIMNSYLSQISLKHVSVLKQNVINC